MFQSKADVEYSLLDNIMLDGDRRKHGKHETSRI